MKKIIVLILAMTLLCSQGTLAFADELEEQNDGDVVNNLQLNLENNSLEPAQVASVQSNIIHSVKPSGKGSMIIKLRKIASDSNVTGYVLLRSNKDRGNYRILCKLKKNRLKFVDKNVRVNRSYYYKVRPYTLVEGKIKVGKLSDRAYGKNTLKYKKVFRVKAYAYSGHTRTASGKNARVGRIAVDPRVIKLGTWMWIEGYGLAQACDTGGNIKGKTVDLFMNSKGACNRWGVRYPKVYILK